MIDVAVMCGAAGAVERGGGSESRGAVLMYDNCDVWLWEVDITRQGGSSAC